MGSAEFASEEEYDAFLVRLLEAGNLNRAKRLGEELEAMHEDVDHGFRGVQKEDGKVILPRKRVRGFVKENPKMEEMQSRYARRYDHEFKENAVALVEWQTRKRSVR